GISGALAQSGGNRRGPNIPPVARPSAEKPSRAPREDLKKIGEKWNDINDRWGKETTRNMEAMEKINNMPEGNPKAQAAAAEAAQHRANSRDLGLERDAVHDEIIKEVNQRVAKGQTEASAPLTKTTGTKANDPGFQGMKSDNDLGGGARTADKVGEVLEDMGIKIKPKIKGGTIEFGDNLNITINKQGKMGPVGSGAHDAQTTVNAGNKETYVSVSMKKPDGTQQPGTDYVEVQDHKKKATPGMEAKPEDLATHPEAAHDMIKGTLKTMDHLSDSEVQQIMDKNNIPGEAKDFRKKMQDIKEGRAKLDPAELEKLQKTSRDIFEKAEQKTGSQADSELEQARQEVDRLKQAGDHDGARKLDSEVKDSRAKKEAVEKANRELADNVRKNGLSEEGKGAGKPTEVKGKGGETSTGKTAEGAGKGPAENPLGTTGKTKSGTSTPSGEPPSGQTGKVNEGTPGGTGQGKGSETSTGKTVEGLGKGSGKSTGGGGGEGPGGRPPDTFVGGGKGSGKSAGNGPDLPPEMPGGGGKAPGESTVGVPGSGKAAKPEGTKTPNSKVTMEGPEGRDSGVKSTEPEVPGTKSGKPAPETMAKAPDAPKVDTPKVEGPEVPGTTKPGATVEIPKTESVATKPAVTDGPTGGKVETPSTPKVEGAGPKVVEAPTGPTVSEAPGGKGRVEIHEFDLPGAIAKALGATPPTAPPGIGGRL
ncbi:MAG: hypothetical protein NTY53_22040, partial [Kiritimatiellaeota bacterium]|nr:hypothetical protein [Kiritimatiellota bacterium]